jgi:hypothetical protein
MLREVEQMSLIELHVSNDRKEPILIRDISDPNKWWTFTVDQFLRFNLERAKAEGATALALVLSQEKPSRTRMSQTEIEELLTQYLSDLDDE